MEEAVNAFLRPLVFVPLTAFALSSWLTLGASMGPTSHLLQVLLETFISGLLVLPALVLVVSGLKRATCAL